MTSTLAALTDPVLEIAEILIIPGRETEFEASMRTVNHLATDFAGCRKLTLSRCLENPSKFVLLVEWDSRAAHTEFTKTAEFPRFRATLRALVAEAPKVEHFRDIGDGVARG